MLITRHRSLTALAAGVLALAALTGCGSADSTKNADAKTTSASSPSAGVTPSSTTSSSTDGVADAGAAPAGARLTKDNLVATMVAAMRAKKTAHMVMQIGSSVEADADLRYSGSTSDMKMSMSMGSTKAVVILVGGVMYMQQSAGGKYVKIDKSDPAMGALLGQMSNFGPESSISAMKGAVKQVQYAGTDTVGGDKVTKYKVTVDTSAVAAQLGASAGAADLPKTVTYDLYVDGQHLMRRIDMTVAKQHVRMDVSDWGKPVDIQAPPAAQVQSH